MCGKCGNINHFDDSFFKSVMNSKKDQPKFSLFKEIQSEFKKEFVKDLLNMTFDIIKNITNE